MKKALFLWTLLLVFASCQKKSAKDEDADVTNHVSVIIDDLLWNGEIGDTIRQKLASPVIGLPQEEPLFTLNQYPLKLLEGYMNSRSILLIKKGPRQQFLIKHDQYTAPQTVMYISGRNTSEIIDVIEKNSLRIISTFKQREIVCLQKQFAKSLLDNERIAKKFGISMLIPTPFKYVVEGEKFLWLKKDITSGNTSIVIYEVPIQELMPESEIVANIIRVRDSIGKLYIHGAAPGTMMVTENSYTPYLSLTTIDSVRTYETRGTWELDRNMSGPFINFAILDTLQSRAVIIEGFCHIPAKQKRNLMLELEAIIRSTTLINLKAD